MCPRGSRALHPDYYSATKKPVFLLDAACRRAEPPQILRRRERASHVGEACDTRRQIARKCLHAIVGNIDEMGTFATSRTDEARPEPAVASARARSRKGAAMKH